MCFFGGGSTPAVTEVARRDPPAIEGAAVDEGYADTLTKKQKMLRTGRTADAGSDSPLTKKSSYS